MDADELKEMGMAQAVEHAESVLEGWKEVAYSIMLEHIKNTDSEFQVEDVREYARTLNFPKAPSERAWGSIVRRANKEGLIAHAGYAKTTNPTAHSTPAALWQRTEQ